MKARMSAQMHCQYQRRQIPYLTLPQTFPHSFSELVMQPSYLVPEADRMCLDASTLTCLCNEAAASNSLDIKTAGLKVFATVMLNSWRRRREEVKRLTKTMEDLRRVSSKSKNQMQMFNTLYLVEQKRSSDLKIDLKHSRDCFKQLKISCEDLASSIMNLRSDKAMLEQELQLKYTDLEALNDMLSQTKSDLFHAMVEQRELQRNLCNEQRMVQVLYEQKANLLNEICQLSAQNRSTEETYHIEIDKKETLCKNAKEKIKQLEREVIELTQKVFDQKACFENSKQLKEEVKRLQIELSMLRRSLDGSLFGRLYTYFNTILNKKVKHSVLISILRCLLPATPPLAVCL